MTDAELIARLRDGRGIAGFGATAKEAADRIEALIAEREQWRRAAETRAEGWKISDDARIEAEIKLAKAVEALGLADDALYEAEAILGGEYGDHYGPLCEMMMKLRATLAAIKAP